MRIRLHYLAGRREDRLVFDHQTALAAQLRLAATRRTARASEQLMQRYYRAAKAVTQLNTILLQNLERAADPRSRRASRAINERFQRARRAARRRERRRLFERQPARDAGELSC